MYISITLKQKQKEQEMKHAEAVSTTDHTPKGSKLRRTGRAVMGFARTQNEKLKAQEARDEQVRRDIKNEPRNQQIIAEMRKSTEARADNFGKMARLFEKVHANQVGHGKEPLDTSVVGNEKFRGTLSYAGIVDQRVLLTGADKITHAQSLVLEHDLGVAPTGENIDLGNAVEVHGALLDRGDLVDQETGQALEKLTLTLLGSSKSGTLNTVRDTRIEAVFDPASDAEPMWQQSVRRTPLGSPSAYRDIPKWSSSFPATPETVAAALAFTEGLLPPVIMPIPEAQQ